MKVDGMHKIGVRYCAWEVVAEGKENQPEKKRRATKRRPVTDSIRCLTGTGPDYAGSCFSGGQSDVVLLEDVIW